MMTPSEVHDFISSEKICVIITTSKQSESLSQILKETIRLTGNIIVVHDGSSDAISKIPVEFQDIIKINFEENTGKGLALKTAFRKALDLGFKYAITIDSGGQYSAEEIPVFIQHLKKETSEILLIGERKNLFLTDVQRKDLSQKISNFWFWFETGIKLHDSQCGFRLYPLEKIPKKFYTPTFDFELEIMVRIAWKNIPVKNIPVSFVSKNKERKSHLKSLTDVIRISVHHSILILITVFYIIPRNFISNFRKKSFRRFLKEDVLASEGNNRKKALSIAIGIFVGFSPFWGLHSLLVIGLSVVFRLNKVLAFVASGVSLPPFIPFLFAASLFVGAPFVSGEQHILSQPLNFDLIKNNFLQYAIGSLILSVSMSATAFFATIIFLNKINPQKENN